MFKIPPDTHPIQHHTKQAVGALLQFMRKTDWVTYTYLISSIVLQDKIDIDTHICAEKIIRGITVDGYAAIFARNQSYLALSCVWPH